MKNTFQRLSEFSDKLLYVDYDFKRNNDGVSIDIMSNTDGTILKTCSNVESAKRWMKKQNDKILCERADKIALNKF